MRPDVKREIIRYLMMILGCAIYSVGFCFFIEPKNIVAGGMGGLAQVVKVWLNNFELIKKIPDEVLTGILIGLLNAPIILVSFFREQIKFTINCLITILTLSLMTSGLGWLKNKYNWNADVDYLTACLFGGIMQGIAIGIYCKYRVSSGGTELIARFMHELSGKKLSIPVMNGICDATIVLLGVVTFKNPTNFLYALLIIFVVTKISDAVIIGINKSKMVYIITTKGDEVGHYLVHNSPRGVTLLPGKGMYTDTDRQVLITVVRKSQVNQLKIWVKDLDPNAFMIVSETNEVMGNGFKHFIDEDEA